MVPLALLMKHQAYRLDRNKALSHQSADAGLLKGYLKYGRRSKRQIVIDRNEKGLCVHQKAMHNNSKAEMVIHDVGHWGDAGLATGNILVPGRLDDWSWMRMPWGDSAFSLVGLVHTLCSRSVQWGLGECPAAPVRHWDALIYTPTAAISVLDGVLGRQGVRLQQGLDAEQLKGTQQLIPVEIHTKHSEPAYDETLAREKTRKQLGIRPHATVVPIAEQLNLPTKYQSNPLIRIQADMQPQNHTSLELVAYGEAPNPAIAEARTCNKVDIAPYLKINWLDGKTMEPAGPVRWAEGVYVSLADNPQETVGITPLEAMASALTCIMGDWVGYRDTVVQTNEENEATEFQMTTQMIDGLGEEESKGLFIKSLPYKLAIERVAQGIAVDPSELKKSLNEILANTDIRHTMGQASKRKGQRLFQWEFIMKQWSNILKDLQERHLSAQNNDKKSCARGLPPWLPACSTSFRSFASEILQNNWSPDQSPTPHQEEIFHNSMMQNWGPTLLTKRGPRRRGRWIKHGLAEA